MIKKSFPLQSLIVKNELISKIIFIKQQIAEIDTRYGIIRMMRHRLQISRVRGAAIPGEEIGAIIRFQESLQGFDAAHQADEIVLVPEREHGVDQIVADALLAQRDFEPVSEKD